MIRPLSASAAMLLACALLLPAPSTSRADENGSWRGWPTPPLLGHSLVVDTTAQRLLLVGGRTATGANRQVLQRNLLTDDGWQLLPMTASSPVIPYSGVVYDARENRVLVIAGDSATTAGEVRVLTLDDPATWSVMPTTGGGPAVGSVDAWLDDSLRQVVCRNGAGLWRLELEPTPTWSMMSAPRVPAGVNNPALVYDSRRHRLLAHGGSTPDWSRFSGSLFGNFRELSLLSGDTASWLSTTGLPSRGRAGHRAFYDAKTDRFVSWGGAISWNLADGTLWECSVSTNAAPVTLIPNAGLVPGPMAFDSRRRHLYLHSDYNQQLWDVSVQSPASNTPLEQVGDAGFGTSGARRQAVLDSKHRRLITFGAYSGNLDNTVYAMPLDSLPAWRPLEVPGPLPDPRFGAAIAWDPVRDRLLIHGGNTFTSSSGGTWALSLSGTPAWTRLQEVGPYVADATAIYNPAHDSFDLCWFLGYSTPMYLFRLPLGGNTNWAQVNVTGTFAGDGVTERITGAYDALRNRWLLALGRTDTTDCVLALDLEHSTVSRLPELGTPLDGYSRYNVAYDLLGDRLLAFGGRRDFEGAPQEYPTWVRSLPASGTGAATTLTPFGPPPAWRFTPMMVVDPVRDRMIVAGGESGLDGLRDTWTLDFNRLGVELVQADTMGSIVRLHWRAPALAGRALQVHRRDYPGAWAKLATVLCDGSGHVALWDTTTVPGHRYSYRLADSTRSQPVISVAWSPGASHDTAGTPPTPPPTLFLARAVPNPSTSGAIRVLLDLPAPGDALFELLDLSGRVVLRSWHPGLGASRHSIALALPSSARAGLYWLSTRVANHDTHQRVVVIR